MTRSISSANNDDDNNNNNNNNNEFRFCCAMVVPSLREEVCWEARVDQRDIDLAFGSVFERNGFSIDDSFYKKRRVRTRRRRRLFLVRSFFNERCG